MYVKAPVLQAGLVADRKNVYWPMFKAKNPKKLNWGNAFGGLPTAALRTENAPLSDAETLLVYKYVTIVLGANYCTDGISLVSALYNNSQIITPRETIVLCVKLQQPGSPEEVWLLL